MIFCLITTQILGSTCDLNNNTADDQGRSSTSPDQQQRSDHWENSDHEDSSDLDESDSSVDIGLMQSPQQKRVFLSRGWGPGGYEVVGQTPISKFVDPPSRPIRKPMRMLLSPESRGEFHFLINLT